MAEPKCTPELRTVDDGWKIQVTVLTTWIPVLLIVAARVGIRKHNRSVFGIDDYLMLAALIPISLGSIFHLVAVSYGLGRHTACLTVDMLSHSIKWQYLGEGMNILSIWVVKLSICFFLLRLLQGTNPKARVFIWVLIFGNTALQLVSFTVCWASTKIPIWAWWTFDITPTSYFPGCITYDRVVFIVNVVIDFVFAISPIYTFWNVRIETHHKYTLCGLMLLAILPSIAGVLKVAYLDQVVSGTDPTFAPVKVDDIAALVEQNGGTFIANLPSIKVLLGSIATSVSQSYNDLLSRSRRGESSSHGSSVELGPPSNDGFLNVGSDGKAFNSSAVTYNRGLSNHGSIVEDGKAAVYTP